VQKGFEEFIGNTLHQATIRPQGLLRKNPYKGRASEAHREICDRHGLPPQTRLVLSVAYVDRRKGPDLFVEIAEKVLFKQPETAFIWVGNADPKMECEVNALILRKNLSARVKFVGFVAEPMTYYAAASVYALTSREDPFPNVVLESAEVGVPIVAFEGTTGAADFIVEHGGRLAKRLDTTDFASQILELIVAPANSNAPRLGSLRQYLMDVLHLAVGLPRVSVVVPNYNYTHHLDQRLYSIVGQTFPPYELIVLDDASTDQSVDVIRKFLQANAGIDYSLVVNTDNSGSVFRQWQNGLARCRGDLVWIAEADDFAEGNFLEELVSSFADPNVVIAYSQSRQVDGDGRVLAGDYLEYTRDISDDWRSDYIRDGRSEIALAMAVKNTIPNVSAVLFRRAALERAFLELGDSLFGYRVAGDWLIYLRILLQGKICFSAKSLNSHRRHLASVTGAVAAQKHLDEVSNMQALAGSLVRVPSKTREKSQIWLEHVRRHLVLTANSDAPSA
jgi:O-antigen biosynthesis protein